MPHNTPKVQRGAATPAVMELAQNLKEDQPGLKAQKTALARFHEDSPAREVVVYRKKIPHQKKLGTGDTRSIAGFRGEYKGKWIKLNIYNIILNKNPKNKIKKSGMRLARAGVAKVKDKFVAKNNKPPVIQQSVERMEAQRAGNYTSGVIDKLILVANDVEARKAQKRDQLHWKTIKNHVKEFVSDLIRDKAPGPLGTLAEKLLPKDIDFRLEKFPAAVVEDYHVAKALIKGVGQKLEDLSIEEKHEYDKTKALTEGYEKSKAGLSTEDKAIIAFVKDAQQNLNGLSPEALKQYEVHKAFVKGIDLAKSDNGVPAQEYRVAEAIVKGTNQQEDNLTPSELTEYRAAKRLVDQVESKPELLTPHQIYKEEFKAANALIEAGFEDIELGEQRMVEHLETSIKELEVVRFEILSDSESLKRLARRADKAQANIGILKAKKQQLIAKNAPASEISGIDDLIKKEQKPLEAKAKLEKLRSIPEQIQKRQNILKNLKGEYVYVSPEVKNAYTNKLRQQEAKLERLTKEIADRSRELDGIDRTIWSRRHSLSETIAGLQSEANSVKQWIDAHKDTLENKVKEFSDAAHYQERQNLKDAAKSFDAQRLFVLRREKGAADKKYKEYKGELADISEEYENIKEHRFMRKAAQKLKNFCDKTHNASKINTIAKGVAAGAIGVLGVIDLAINVFEVKRHYGKAKKFGKLALRAQNFSDMNNKKSVIDVGQVPNLPGGKDLAFEDKLKQKAFQLDDPDFNAVARRFGAVHSRRRNIFKACVDALGAASAGLQIASAGCLLAGVGAATSFPPMMGVVGGVMAGAMIGFGAYKMYKKVGHSDKLKAVEQELVQIRNDYHDLEKSRNKGAVSASDYEASKADIDKRAMKCHEDMMRYDPDYQVSTLYSKLLKEEGSVSIDDENTRPTAVMLQYLGVPEESIQAAIDAANPRAAIDLLKLELGYKVKTEREHVINPSDYDVEEQALTKAEKKAKKAAKS